MSWEALWIAAIRVEQGTKQVPRSWTLDICSFLQLDTFLKVRHRLLSWTEEGAGAEGGNRLLWMKERKFGCKYLSEAPEKEEGEVVKEVEKVEEEQSLDVRSQIDWWDTRTDEQPDSRVAKCTFVVLIVAPFLNVSVLHQGRY